MTLTTVHSIVKVKDSGREFRSRGSWGGRQRGAARRSENAVRCANVTRVSFTVTKHNY